MRHRARAILGFDTTIIGELITGSTAIYTGMTANSSTFPTPVPALSVLLAQTQAVEASQATVNLRTRGSTTARNAKRASLVSTLGLLVAYVQSVADASPAESAAMVIESAGMKVAAVGVRQKPEIAAKAGPVGTVHVFANATLLSKGSHKKRLFTWQMTLDGGKTFVATMPPTSTAQTSVSGLTSLASVGFRVAVTLAGEPQGEWTQVVYVTAP